MALQLLPLLFGGYAAKLGIDRGLARRDRQELSEGAADIFATPGQTSDTPAPVPGATIGQARRPDAAQTFGITPDLEAAPIGAIPGNVQFNQDGSIGAQSQTQQPGIFPNSGIADPQQMLQRASALFALPGGAQMAQGLVSDAFQFAQQNQQTVQEQQFRAGQQQLDFGQRNLEQDARFGQQDALQANQQEFTTTQNNLNREADLNEFNRSLEETTRHNKAQENIKLASEGYTFDANGNPVQDPDAARLAASQGELGTVPSGYSRHVSPDGLSTFLKAEPGSDDYRNAQKELSTGNEAIIAIDEQIQSIKDSGTNVVGEDAATQNARYGRIISAIAAMRELGVIQKDEAERLEESIPNPADVWSHVARNDSSIIAAYEELQHQFQSNLKTANQMYSHWGLGSMLAEATPEQIRALNARAEASAAAARDGLKVDTVATEPPPTSDFDPTRTLVPMSPLEALWGAAQLGGLFANDRQ